MKVAVISPLRRTGISTITSLLGLAITWTQKLRCAITYFGDSDVPRYNGIVAGDDMTRSISQLAKLLQEHAIPPEAITEYCLSTIKDNWILDTTSSIVTVKQKADIVSFVFDQVPTDFVVCDLDGDLGDPAFKGILESAEVVIVVFEPYRTQLDEIKRYRESKDWPKDKRILYMCNKYDPVIMALRNVSADLGIKHTDLAKLHYNPWITKMCDQGKILDLLKAIVAKDPRVIELNTDLLELICFFMNQTDNKVKWEGK